MTKVDWKIISKVICAVCIALVIPIVMAGCSSSSSKSISFKVDTGDSIRITLDTSSGYDLEQSDGVWSVSDEGETVLNCMWGSSEAVEEYVSLLEQQGVGYENVEIGEFSGIKWQYEGEAGTEYDYILKITDNTSVIIGSLSEKSDEALQLVSFVVE